MLANHPTCVCVCVCVCQLQTADKDRKALEYALLDRQLTKAKAGLEQVRSVWLLPLPANWRVAPRHDALFCSFRAA